MKKQHLAICESFYSIQGEGPSMGTPALFLRLAGCNLQCPGFSYRHPETGEHLGCDTKHVWRQGKLRSFDDILAFWETKTWLDKLAQGAHLVISGGEPLMQQTPLLAFILALKTRIPHVFIEIETNATQAMATPLIPHLNQINASPKLKCSGEPAEKRYLQHVLTQYAAATQCVFKFVVQTSEDVSEIDRDFVTPLNLSPDRIWLMPEGGTKDAIMEKSPWIIELCKQRGFRFTTRLHILLWGEVVGV
ncbi:MAG: 7-carboxy-7-deazaguanine synthase [marine bacterium B5-7]|nr:MAG: 7-carboxy-7-deazaguanine synthase [marine bacterium B5-7]